MIGRGIVMRAYRDRRTWRPPAGGQRRLDEFDGFHSDPEMADGNSLVHRPPASIRDGSDT